MADAEKPCNECGEVKRLSDFYVHHKMPDGYLNKCKECVKNRVRLHREKNLERVRAYDRERGRSEERKARLRADFKKNNPRYAEWKERDKEFRKKWINKNPEKRAAHVKVGNAIRDGKLERGVCEVCGSDKVEAHHDDYTKPLEVRWLCKSHHMELHRKYPDLPQDITEERA